MKLLKSKSALKLAHIFNIGALLCLPLIWVEGWTYAAGWAGIALGVAANLIAGTFRRREEKL